MDDAWKQVEKAVEDFRQRCESILSSQSQPFFDMLAAIEGQQRGIVIADQLLPPEVANRIKTVDDFMDVVIGQVTQACRKYWAQTKAKGNT